MTCSMNLLPVAYRRRLLVGRRVRQWSRLWVIAAAASCAVCVTRGMSLMEVRQDLAALQVRNQPLVEMESGSAKIVSRIAALEGRASILNELTGVSHPLSLIAAVSRSAEQADRQLQVHSLTIQHIAPAESKSESPAADGTGSATRPTTVELSIRGVALDDAAVSRFVQALGETRLFSTVELKSTLSVNHQDSAVRQYDVLCRRSGA